MRNPEEINLAETKGQDAHGYEAKRYAEELVKAQDMKFDGGKILAGIPFQDFPRALQAVAEVGTFGAKKYSRSSWKTVDNAMTRYTDAKFRHILEGEISERDIESGLLHKAHEAWNALATLELYLTKE